MKKKPRDHRYETDDLLLVVRYKGEQNFEIESWQSSFFQTRKDYTVHVFQKKSGGGFYRLGALTHVRPSPMDDSPKAAAVDALAFAHLCNWYEWDASLGRDSDQDPPPYADWSPSEKRYYRLHDSYDWQTLPQTRDGEFRVRSAR